MAPSGASAPRYTVVIPVYNSAGVVGETIDRTLAFFERSGLSCEIVAVNDGSTDGAWQVLSELARTRPGVVAINLLRNYGQHAALMCGLRHSRGEWVVTIDDDLQNPPEEIAHLIEATGRGHDVVCGRFRQKRHPLYRRLGSKLVGRLDRHVFQRPPGLSLTNFRIMRRDVVDRMCAYPTPYPYIRGLMLMCSSNPADVWVEHHPRPRGPSSYNTAKLLTFVARIVFSYSTLPIRIVLGTGLALVVLGVGGAVYLLSVPGASTTAWTIVGLAVFNGITIASVGIVAQYVTALIRQSRPAYQISETIGVSKSLPVSESRAAVGM